MKKYSFILFLTCLASQTMGQTMDLNSPQIIDLGLRIIALHGMGKDTPKEKVEGSVYLNDQFGEAFIITERGEFNPQKMRYNIFEDAMEFEMGGKILMMDASPLIKSVTIGQEVFVAADFPYKTRTMRGFLERIYRGKYGLYAKKNISYRESEPPKALKESASLAKYVRRSDTYFMKIPDQNLVKVTGIKNILALLPEKAAALKKYAKKEKLSNKDLSSMARVLKFADTL